MPSKLNVMKKQSIGLPKLLSAIQQIMSSSLTDQEPILILANMKRHWKMLKLVLSIYDLI
jgi:hypothetical protein